LGKGVEPFLGVGEGFGELLALAVECGQFCRVALEGGLVGQQRLDGAGVGVQLLRGVSEGGGLGCGVRALRVRMRRLRPRRRLDGFGFPAARAVPDDVPRRILCASKPARQTVTPVVASSCR
jgi:hypothetical protein